MNDILFSSIKRLNRPALTVFGVFLILIGVFVPTAALMAGIRAIPADQASQLLQGGLFFKAALILFGIYIVGLSNLRIWQSPSSAMHPGQTSQSKSILVTLGVVLVASVLLRVYQLNSGLWLDEILTYVKYARLPFGVIITTFDSENQHFLYSILAHASFLFFGESTWALRLPAVLFGVGSLWALFLLGRQISSEREALLAVALLAFSYHHVWFSQNARGYTGMLFWTILSSYFFLRGLREARPQAWVLYGISAALGLYTHLTMGFVVLGQLIIYGFTLIPRRWKQWPEQWFGLFIGFGVAGLLTFVLYALVVPQLFGVIGSSEKSVVTEWKSPLWTAIEILKGLEISFAGGAVALGALLLFGAGVWSYTRKNLALIGLAFLPPVIGATVTIAVGHHLWPRFFFFAFGFGALLVIRGAITLGDIAGRLLRLSDQSVVRVGTAASLGLILVSAFSVPFAYGPKQDYEGALKYVDANLQPGDDVVTVSLTTFPYQDFYRTGWKEVTSVQDLDRVRSHANQTWLLYTFPPVLESVYPDVMASIQRDFEVVKRFNGTVGDGEIYVCRAGKLSTALVKAH